MALNLPVLIVATVLAFIYGASLSIRHAILEAIITFAFVLAGGMLYKGVGQIIAVVLSALVIFVAFTLPAHRRKAAEEADRERELRKALQEEAKYANNK